MGFILVAILGMSNGLQPACTEEDFQMAFGNSTQGDTAFIARVVFDDYLEQLIAVDQEYTCEEDVDAPPLGTLMLELSKENAVDALFDTLLSSLLVLNESADWKLGIANLRRTVLLRARKAKNPWQGVVWVDIPNMPTETVLQLDLFLQNNIDEDRTERYYGLGMQSWGEAQKCRKFEKQAMERWGTFLQIIAPSINEGVLYTLYPQLDQGKEVHRVSRWMFKHVLDKDILASVRKQIELWGSLHKRQNQTIVDVIVKTRSKLGFDPWSRGCGIPAGSPGYKIKNELLQKSAEIQEFNNSIIEVILNLLTEEQRQLFEKE